LAVDGILRASGDGLLAGAVGAFYHEVDRRIETQGLRCRNCGRCCDFGRCGHRLFVTSVELAYFVWGQGGAVRSPAGRCCPYQEGGACVARGHRPVGCRLFFCDPQSREWQARQYEDLRARLVGLHEEFGVGYAYVEWLEALGRLSAMAGAGVDREGRGA
jgi:hypothetical protein